ncbi:Spy0128 family protein [Collinsella intestinalis]|uniref:Spy0128 family protein n=1 Tax=Collinsella intestinalis TaxID=147207 RepID=UPI001EF6D275|nr:FctA domain-containing protein [Collinsella intestinalis]
MYLGKKKRFGGRLFALLAALLIVASTLFAVPAYATDGSTSGNPVADFFGGIAQTLGLAPADESPNVQVLSTEGADTAVDPDTTNVWTNFTRPDGHPSTQNVGRIWTDKSVFNGDYSFTNDDNAGLSGQTIGKGDSDFLVSLSALSSTSNLKEMVQTGKPLDIVLVFDMSGSMDESFGQGPNQQSRINALKTAANSFINATAAANDDISDPNLKHQISLVKFAGDKSDEVGNDKYYGGFWPFGQDYNYSQVVSELGVYNTSNASQLTGLVNQLDPDGGTQTDYGMEVAQEELASHGREGAQQVVIFFTDGEPGDGYSFNTTIANSTVNTARELKQSGALVYSVGIFTGASSTNMNSSANQFMQAVSSNYPNATAYNNRGERGEGDYYKTAADADELNTIFEDIFDETQEGASSGSPIEENTQQGNTEPGTLTFEDQLGNYMQVTGTYDQGGATDKMQLAYGDKIYTSTNKTTEGDTDTYHFSGVVDGNEIYGPADLSDLVVTVQRSTDPAVGDKVTVTLPASLLPMRHYDVDTDAGTMTVSQAYPVRLFYGVSLKAEATEALADPTSDAYATLVASQKSSDGTSIDFYSNSFVKNAADGSTTASFSPNAGNKFYYYTQDTTLYTDPECTTEANRYTVGNATTLYYKDVYWVQTGDGDGAREVTEGYGTVTSGTAEWNAIQRPNQGAYYIPANTQRTERPHTLTDVKDTNETGTAGNVLNPSWTVGGDVTQALGNNGKLSLKMPGSLEIKKDVDWGNASDQTKQDKNEFTFDITNAAAPTGEGEATEPLAGTYNYYVGDSDTAAGQVTFTNGSATLTVDGGTTVRIDGLPAGTTFTVTEQGVGQNGWTVTDATSQEDVENTNTTDGMVTGTIPAGSQASLTFGNTYHADEVGLNTDTTLKVQKNLEGRDWRDTDEFTFDIDGLGNTAGTGVTTPEPADTTITVNSQTPDHTASFGDITFTMPGEYRYSIVEDNDTNPIAGIDYSGAFYRVVVTVTDNGTGNLKVSNVDIEQRTNDDGVENDPVVEVQGDTVTFVNKYDADGGTTNIDGTKDYTDNAGGNPINADKFTFKIEALGGYDSDDPQTNPYTYGVDEVPLPAGSDATSHSKTVYNTGYNFTFGTIAFDGDDLGRTYEYKVTELAQNKDGQAEAGMAYDKTEYTVKVTVKEVTDDDGTHIVATPDIAPANLKFTNTYDPADATLTGTDAIHGTKTLTGRDMKEGETFYFQLEATNENAKSLLPNAKTVEVTSLTDGSADFNFGDMSFSKVGKYTFTVNEVADQNGTETTDGFGMTYDRNVCTVTVNVTDNHDGTLKADVTYSNNVNSSVTDKAQFNNTYKASMNYGAEGAGGIVVTKTLNDRSEANNTFLFTITGDTEEDTAKLHDQDRKFSHGPLTPGVPNEMEKLQELTFDETDAGKTYTFIVDELEDEFGPNESADTLKGVDFDQSQYRVDIEVLDNGDGTMHTVTTVTKTMDKDGSVVNEAVYGPSDSATVGYTAPKFGFVNDYNPDPAVVGGSADAKIQVTKTVEGADSAADYTFTLTPVDPDQAQYIEGLTDGKLEVSTNGTIAEGTSQTVEFGELRFTKADSYSFIVKENQPAEDAGWTFDDADGDGATDTHNVEIVITDKNADGKYDGKLYVQSVTSENGEGQPVQITNSYETDPVVVGGEDAEQQITVQKSVTGDNTAADAAFNFRLEPVVDDTNTEDVWRANVEAAEDGFEPKTTITDGVTTDAPKTATFGGIRFKAAGDYTFKVTEVEGTDDQADPSGWKYDGHEAFVTVHVTDDGEGKLGATVSYNNDGATDADKGVTNAAAFTNTYTGSGELDGATDLVVTKNLVGRDWTADDEFTFSIAAGDPTTQQAVDAGNVTLPDSPITIDSETKNHIAAFGNIQFSGSGEHTYTFVVKENVPEGANADNGWTYDHLTYDNSFKTVTVHVTDNGSGELTAELVDESSDELTFTNVYYNPDEAKESAPAEGDTNGVQVGDILTYTIDWANNAVDAEGKPVAAEVTVTDTLPAGLAYVGVPEGAVEPTSVSDDYKTIVWELDKQDVGAADTLTFNARVTEDAAPAGEVNNQATVKVGNNEHQTNFTHDEIGTGNLTISKTVTVDEEQGTQIDTNKAFTFTIALTDTAGNPLTGAYTLGNVPGEEAPQLISFAGDEAAEIPAGSAVVTLKHGENIVIQGLPEGASYTVTENLNNAEGGADYGYAQVAPVDGEQAAAPATGTIPVGDENASAEFVNAYSTDPGEVPGTGDTDKAFNLTKQFTGRDGNAWLDTDEFSFTLTPVDGAPMPTEGLNEDGTKTVTVGVANVADPENGIAPINFGDITYATAGTYKYTVTETNADDTINGVTYDGDTVNITVTVTDKGSGKLTAAVTKTGEDANASFTNTYDSTIHYGADGKGGLTITKQLNNRDMTAGQFTMTVTAADDDSANKIGGQTVELESAAAAANTAAPVTSSPFDNVTFNLADAGKTFAYTIAETGTAPAGYQFDTNVYTVSITPRDNGDGTMTVSTQVTSGGGYNEMTEGVATVPFVNTYDPDQTTVGANGSATIVAHKTLENDDIANYEGAFTFKVTDGDTVVATGSNDAAGNITFSDIAYTSEELYKATHGGSDVIGTATMTTDETTGNEVYTFAYSVTEDALPGDNGVSYVSGNGGVTVVVTDDHSGKLSAEVVYDNDAQSIEFVNAYGTGTDGATTLTLAGSKQLVGVNGAQAPALKAVQFNFSIVGNAATDGTRAPMPESVTATNAKSGAVSFGPITYTMENVFGAEASATDESATNEGIETYTAGRTKEFTYTVTENQGGEVIDGITYDASSQTIEVTVTDEGDGKISAAVTGVSDAAKGNDDFTFVNTYAVIPVDSTPTGNGGLTFTKVFDPQSGTRQLAEGDFTFQLTDPKDTVVATGVNDADGKVTMSAIKFTQAGDYSYTLSEVVPEGATPNADGSYTLDGVTYRPAQYTVTAHVEDNHNGTLTVTWDMTNADGDATTTAEFVNVYNVDPTTVTFGAAKVLEGREIAEGEFEFELKDAQGNVVATATNDADGAVTFVPQTFGDAGTYEFTISEVQGDAEGVTYDTTVYDVVLTLVDNDKGGLEVTELTYNGAAALPVFNNTYTEPPAPVEPDEVIPATGDAAVAAVAATVAIGGTLVAAGYVTSKKRGE